MRQTDDANRDHQRAPDRIYCEDDRWYVTTREGLRGPFGSRRAAAAEAALFVDTMTCFQRSRSLPGRNGPDDATSVDQTPPSRQ